MKKFLLLLCLIQGITVVSMAQTWTQKAQFPGIGRWTALGFSIGSKGYICGGMMVVLH